MSLSSMNRVDSLETPLSNFRFRSFAFSLFTFAVVRRTHFHRINPTKEHITATPRQLMASFPIISQGET